MGNFKKIIFVLVLSLLLLQIIMLNNDDDNKISLKPMVAVSSFALYDITKHIVGNSIKIINILPFGVDAHSFEPTPKLMTKIARSKLVIFSGAGLEPWIDGFNINPNILDISKSIKLRGLTEIPHEGHGHEGHVCSHSNFDPHYWLDVSNMKIATVKITQALIKAFPQNKTLYIKNQELYLDTLSKLDENYKNGLKSCKINTIITNHDAFSYLANKYNFKVEALNGLSPEAAPSAKDIKRLMTEIEDHNIQTIFFESFVSDKFMKSIAKDVNVKVDTLQPLGNITANEAEQNLTYSDLMNINLEKLSKALVCN